VSRREPPRGGADAPTPPVRTTDEPTSLIVVSNRLPFKASRRAGALQFERSPGGLVSALDPVLQQRGGVWVGWSGVTHEEGGETLKLPYSEKVKYRAVPLSSHDISQYYAAFSNRTIWPLFHYFVDHTRIDAGAWRVYERVNERFAEDAAAEHQDDALVWIHDYHLLRTPHHLRRLLPHVRMAFFLHIPFPSAEVFRILPWSRLLMRGILASDLVAFHAPSYVEHFLVCAERLLGCEVDWDTGRIRFEGHQVTVRALPIGIDVDNVERLAAGLPPAYVHDDEPLAHILGVDRLDYTKGIYQRMLAIERLLEQRPQYRRHLLFTQVLVPSRERVAEYRDLKREIDETVGRINGRFSERGWSPIRYHVRSLPFDELVPLYRQADVALVTPLRDGMNLVAKEYVASQIDNEGVLILSEMAGAADELQEALIVNPFDIDAVAESLHRALAMSDEERRARMSALRSRVRANDVFGWVDRFLVSAETASAEARATEAQPVDVTRRQLAPWLARRQTVALFLDYDGTLTPIVRRPELAKLTEVARGVLQRAGRTPNLDITIVSGRALEDVKRMVGVPGLTYVGNHGFEISGPGISFRHEAALRARGALAAAAADLEALDLPGAWVERKGMTVSFHVRDVANSVRNDAERRAAAILRRRKLRVSMGKRVVEGRPDVDWHKGTAVLHVLNQRHGTDWLKRVRALYVGDDVTDEDAFQSLKGIGRSIRVAAEAPEAGTVADFRLPAPDDVIQLLRWLASGAFGSLKR